MSRSAAQILVPTVLLVIALAVWMAIVLGLRVDEKGLTAGESSPVALALLAAPDKKAADPLPQPEPEVLVEPAPIGPRGAAEPAPVTDVVTTTTGEVGSPTNGRGGSSADRLAQRLLALQDGDGGWRSNDAALGRRGTTALGVLFLLGRGQPGDGEPEALTRALEFLKSTAHEVPTALSEPAVALALSEAVALQGRGETADPGLVTFASESVNGLLDSARPDGSWALAGSTEGDVLASGLSVMAMKSASFGRVLPDRDRVTASLKTAAEWFDVQAERVAALPPGSAVASETRDASIVVISKMFLGSRPTDERLDHASRVLAAAPYDPTAPLLTYFTTMSLFQTGGERWTRWCQTLDAHLTADELPADPAEAALLGLSAEIRMRYKRHAFR